MDGVLCASAEEASIAACRAAYVLWPQVMKNAQEMTLNEAGVRQSWVDYDWEQLLEHRSSKLSPAPPWLLYKVQQLRPACRAEWELIVFARLCVEEAIACRANRAKGRAGARPLTVGELNPIGQSLVVFEIFCWRAGFRTLKICKKRWRIPGAKVVAAFWKKQNSSGKSWNLSISQWPLGLLRKVSTVSPAVISFPLYKVCRCLGSASKIFPVHQTIKEVGLGKMDGSYIPTWAPLRRR